MSAMVDERRETIDAFRQAVNMTASRLRKWLQSEGSREVGWTHEGERESVGHHSGERIVALLHKKTSDYDDDDLAHMKKVVGYVHRHMAQRPKGDVRETRWRYSLMNWGHDPLESKR